MRQPTDKKIRRSISPGSRPLRLVAAVGLTLGVGFAAVTGISSAASTTSSAPSPVAPGRSGHPFGPGGMGGFGSAGTITAIKGTTLTLRTENGTETVDTTTSTTYTKEQATTAFAALRSGDVVRIATPSSTSTSATSAGTGSVTASSVEVVVPVLSGRVSAINGDTYELVGPEGQLLSVTTSSTTRFLRGKTTIARAAVPVGTLVVAEGSQDSLTHVFADTIVVSPADSFSSGAFGGFGARSGGPGWASAKIPGGTTPSGSGSGGASPSGATGTAA